MSDIDPIKGMEWYNSLTREQRKYWLEQTQNYVPAEAYKLYLTHKTNQGFGGSKGACPLGK